MLLRACQRRPSVIFGYNPHCGDQFLSFLSHSSAWLLDTGIKSPELGWNLNNTRFFFPTKLIWQRPQLNGSPNSTNQTSYPNIASFPSGNSEPLSGRRIILDPCQPGRKEMFFFKNYTDFGYELYFLPHKASASITTCVFIEYLIPYIGIPRNMASDQRAHLTAKAVTHIRETCWSYRVLHHPEATVLMEWYTDALKKKCKYVNKSLQLWGVIWQDTVYILVATDSNSN